MWSCFIDMEMGIGGRSCIVIIVFQSTRGQTNSGKPAQPQRAYRVGTHRARTLNNALC